MTIDDIAARHAASTPGEWVVLKEATPGFVGLSSLHPAGCHGRGEIYIGGTVPDPELIECENCHGIGTTHSLKARIIALEHPCQWIATLTDEQANEMPLLTARQMLQVIAAKARAALAQFPEDGKQEKV